MRKLGEKVRKRKNENSFHQNCAAFWQERNFPGKMIKLCFSGGPTKYRYPDNVPVWALERYGSKRRYGYFISMPRKRFDQLLECDQIYYPDGMVEIISLNEFSAEAKAKLVPRPDGAYDSPVPRVELIG